MAEELGQRIRREMLQVVEEFAKKDAGHLQTEVVLQEVAQRVGGRGIDFEQAVLTVFSDFFRTGQLAWGLNFSNAQPPFFHVTEQGRKALEHMGRDPSNPAGYLADLVRSSLNAVARSYIGEALDCYNADCVRAAAVMAGVASESLVLELAALARDRLSAANEPVPKGLSDWKARTVLEALGKVLEERKKKMPVDLREAVEAYWPAFTHQIRATRNDAGHPTNIFEVPLRAVGATMSTGLPCASLPPGTQHTVKFWIGARDTAVPDTQDNFRIIPLQ